MGVNKLQVSISLKQPGKCNVYVCVCVRVIWHIYAYKYGLHSQNTQRSPKVIYQPISQSRQRSTPPLP